MARTLYKGQDFDFFANLSYNDRPLRINDAATVRAAIFDNDGTIQTAWTSYAKNNGSNTDWQLGVVAERIPASETSGISSSAGELRINIQGTDEDRSGNLGQSYDRTWSWGLTIK